MPVPPTGTGTTGPCYWPHVQGGPIDWSVQQERDKSRTYRVKYLVRINPQLHGPGTAINAGGLPLVGSVWNDCPDPNIANEDVWAWFTAERSASPFKSDKAYDNQYMVVECIATTKPKQDCLSEGTDNPLAVPDRVRIETINYNKEAVYDRFGNPILNSAWEQIRGHQVEFDNHRLRVYIEQNAAALELDLIQSLMHNLNDANLWGFGPRRIKLSHYEGEPKYYTNCSKYWLRRFVFDIADDFDRCILDEGTKVLRGKWDKNPNSPTYGQYLIGTVINPVTGDAIPVNPDNPRDFIQYQDWNMQPSRVILNGNGLPYDPVLGNGTGTITDATNATPIVITSAGHNLLSGDTVTITGVGGNTAANGTWEITVINTNTFSLNGSVGNGAYTAGGSWSYTSVLGEKCIEYYDAGNLLLLGIPLSIE